MIFYIKGHAILITDKIIDIRAFDVIEPNNSDSDRKSSGNNRYSYSNQRQWLNIKELNWFAKTHNAYEQLSSDKVNYNTPYDTKTGFLNLFKTKEIN